MSATPSFQLLLSRMDRGDPNRVAEIVVERFAARLAGLAARKMSQNLQKRVAPEDVVQSVFATFFRRQHDGEFEIRDWESLWGLLAKIATWRICRHAEHHTAARRCMANEVPVEQGVAVLDRDPTPADLVIAEELHTQLMQGMSEKYQPIVQGILDGMTHESIARELGTSLSTVERVHRRAKECLGEFLTVEEKS